MMSISELVCKKFNVDRSCDVPYKEATKFLINYLGYEQVKQCIPFTIDEIKNALVKDEHLNNLSMDKWRKASGLISVLDKVKHVPSLLTDLYRKHKINAYSQAQGVCILKECARMWAQE